MLLAAKGYSKKYIAEKMYISETTVSTHLVNIYEKYGINKDKTYDQRTRAAFLFFQQLQIQKKIQAELSAINNQIRQFIDWMEESQC